jgi:hypothetical protein
LQIGNGSHDGIFPIDGLRVLHCLYKFGFWIWISQQFDIFIFEEGMTEYGIASRYYITAIVISDVMV